LKHQLWTTSTSTPDESEPRLPEALAIDLKII
jgi:hypothetical protein